jgi:hypothetical protein
MAVAPNLQVRARMLERENASIKPVGGRPVRVVTQSATDSVSQGAEPIDWLGNVPGGQMTTGMGRVPSIWEGRASVRQRKKASPSK